VIPTRRKVDAFRLTSTDSSHTQEEEISFLPAMLRFKGPASSSFVVTTISSTCTKEPKIRDPLLKPRDSDMLTASSHEVKAHKVAEDKTRFSL